MTQPTELQLTAAMAAARQAMNAYSTFYSGMIADSVLQPVILKALIAALNTKVSK